MTQAKLSVNINKIATLRNSRGGNNPSVVEAAIKAQQFGAEQGHSFIIGVLDKAAKEWLDPASISPLTPV